MRARSLPTISAKPPSLALRAAVIWSALRASKLSTKSWMELIIAEIFKSGAALLLTELFCDALTAAVVAPAFTASQVVSSSPSVLDFASAIKFSRVGGGDVSNASSRTFCGSLAIPRRCVTVLFFCLTQTDARRQPSRP